MVPSRWTSLPLVVLSCALAEARHNDVLYALDPTWTPGFPEGSSMFAAVGVARHGDHVQVFVTQRGNASIDPVLVVDAKTGTLQRTFGSNLVWLDARTTPTAPTWGAHGLGVERLRAPVASLCKVDPDEFRIWINDFTSCSVLVLDECGQLLKQLGTPGTCGSTSKPLLFDHNSDTVFRPAARASPRGAMTMAFISDGDGGSANRVISLMVPDTLTDPVEVRWATDAIFENPHGVVFHERSDLLIVADREHYAIRFLHASNGTESGQWSCPGLQLGTQGVPFAVRTFPVPGIVPSTGLRDLDLLIIGIMDNPQDGKHQRIVVLDVSSLGKVDLPQVPCKVLQDFTLDPSELSGPHFLDVDGESGDLYVALVANKPKSTVLRYRLPQPITIV